jgi:hypothetical protein
VSRAAMCSARTSPSFSCARSQSASVVASIGLAKVALGCANFDVTCRFNGRDIGNLESGSKVATQKIIPMKTRIAEASHITCEH